MGLELTQLAQLLLKYAMLTPSHRQGNCRKVGCSIGLRRKTYFMLGGSVLGVWSHIEEVFNRCSANQRMQIIRIRTQQKRLVGEWKLMQY